MTGPRSIVRITARGGSACVTVPTWARRAAGWELGDYLLVEFRGDLGVIVMRRWEERARARAEELNL